MLGKEYLPIRRCMTALFKVREAPFTHNKNHIWISQKHKPVTFEKHNKICCQANTRGLVHGDSFFSLNVSTHKQKSVNGKSEVKVLNTGLFRTLIKAQFHCASRREVDLWNRGVDRLQVCKAGENAEHAGRLWHLWLKLKDFHASHTIETTLARAEREPPFPSCS